VMQRIFYYLSEYQCLAKSSGRNREVMIGD